MNGTTIQVRSSSGGSAFLTADATGRTGVAHGGGEPSAHCWAMLRALERTSSAVAIPAGLMAAKVSPHHALRQPVPQIRKKVRHKTLHRFLARPEAHLRILAEELAAATSKRWTIRLALRKEQSRAGRRWWRGAKVECVTIIPLSRDFVDVPRRAVVVATRGLNRTQLTRGRYDFRRRSWAAAGRRHPAVSRL